MKNIAGAVDHIVGRIHNKPADHQTVIRRIDEPAIVRNGYFKDLSDVVRQRDSRHPVGHCHGLGCAGDAITGITDSGDYPADRPTPGRSKRDVGQVVPKNRIAQPIFYGHRQRCTAPHRKVLPRTSDDHLGGGGGSDDNAIVRRIGEPAIVRDGHVKGLDHIVRDRHPCDACRHRHSFGSAGHAVAGIPRPGHHRANRGRRAGRGKGDLGAVIGQHRIP